MAISEYDVAIFYKRKNQRAIVSFGICDNFENQLEGIYVNSLSVGEDIREYLKIICGNGFFRARAVLKLFKQCTVQQHCNE